MKKKTTSQVRKDYQNLLKNEFDIFTKRVNKKLRKHIDGVVEDASYKIGITHKLSTELKLKNKK